MEIVSRSNRKQEIDEKVDAYLAAGANEVWVISTAGNVQIFGSQGELKKSAFPVEIELPPLPKSP